MFSSDFDTPLLIIIYAILILGGAGSLGGVILGALVVNVSLEVLRTPNHATWIFFILILATLLVKLRPWRWLVRSSSAGRSPSASPSTRSRRSWSRAGRPARRRRRLARRVARALGAAPVDPTMIGNCGFVLLVVAVLVLTLLHGWKLLAAR